MSLTPAEIQAMVDQAWEDVLNEFAGCLGEVLDDQTRTELRTQFDATIKKGIENFGALWEDPLKAYGLRQVCMIAKAMKKCKDDISIASCLAKVGPEMIKMARQTCDRIEKKDPSKKLGILCPR